MNPELQAHNHRYEIKMVCEESQLFEARSWIRLHPLGFRQAFNTKTVKNIYFDSPDWDCFENHFNGLSERQKLRFRWWGEHYDNILGHLELKKKKNRVNDKAILPVTVPISLSQGNWQDIMRIILENISGEFKELLAVSRPVLINSFVREYYVAACDKTRLTLDYQLQSFDQTLSPKPNIKFLHPETKIIILELKEFTADAKDLAEKLAPFPLRVVNHSKYITSIYNIFDWQ